LDQSVTIGSGCTFAGLTLEYPTGPIQEELMLAPNPRAETFTPQAEETTETNTTFLEKFVFVAVLVVVYTAAAAALAYPVVMYVFC
jgi:hypothetical protein